MAKEVEQDKITKIQVVQVAKEVEDRIATPDGEVLTQLEALAWIMDKLVKIEKTVG